MSKQSKRARVAPATQARASAAPAPQVETKVEAQAPAAPETPAPEAKVETPAKVRYAKRDWAAGDVITLLVVKNPKSKKSAARYALYKSGMTVAEYGQAVVDGGHGNKTLANADLRWDVAREFISIAPAKAS